MLEIPGVITPMVEGTVRQRKCLITDAFQDESLQKKACAESSSVVAPVAEDNVGKTSSTYKQVTSSVTESVTTTISATGEQAAAGTQDSEKSEKTDKLEPVNKRLDTYMKPNQCVCGFEAKSASELKIHHGFQHPEKSFRCFGLVANDDGKTIKCPFERDDEGQMWCHYRTCHLGLYYNYCPHEGCTHGADGGAYGADVVDSVWKHMYEKHGQKEAAKLVCPNNGCGHVAGAKYLLDQHLKKCNAKDKKIKFYTCEIFQSFDAYSRHPSQKHPAVPGDDSTWYHCPKCPKKFANIPSRESHMKKHEAPPATESKAPQEEEDSD